MTYRVIAAKEPYRMQTKEVFTSSNLEDCLKILRKEKHNTEASHFIVDENNEVTELESDNCFNPEDEYYLHRDSIFKRIGDKMRLQQVNYDKLMEDHRYITDLRNLRGEKLTKEQLINRIKDYQGIGGLV